MSSGAEYLRKTLTGGLLEPASHRSRSKEARNEAGAPAEGTATTTKKVANDEDDIFVCFLYASLLFNSQ